MNKNLLKKIYQIMHLIRFSQEHLINIYHPEDKMKCPIHFCKGQEALASCLSQFLVKDDYILSHHRSHGYYISKKCPIDQMVAEFYGKRSGSNEGLAGSQELSYSKNNFYSGTILSGMFSIALGTAYVQKIYNKRNITYTVIGDGGMEEGIVYETLNLASLKSLPILFICENNRYSVHTNINVRTKSSNFKKKVESFDIKYIKISEYEIESIFKKLKEAIQYIKSNAKPVFIEYDTMRTCGHVGPEDDDKEHDYRKLDLLKWKNKDSFIDLRKKLIRISNIKSINLIEKRNINIVKSAVTKAQKAKTLNFNTSLKYNLIKKFSNKVKSFAKPSIDFKSDQKITKLNPY